MPILDPLTDLYSHKRRFGSLTKALSKVPSGAGISDMPEGYAEGGGVLDWVNKNIVQPVQTFGQSVVKGYQQSSTPTQTSAPAVGVAPSGSLGSGYAQQGANAISNHMKQLQDASKGYAESGAVDDDPLKRLQDSPVAHGVRQVVSAAALPVTAGLDIGNKIFNTGNGGDKDYLDTGKTDRMVNYGTTGNYAPSGANVPTYYGPQNDGITSAPPTVTAKPAVKQITAAPPLPSATSATPPPPITPPADTTTATTNTDPLTDTTTQGSGFAQVGKNKIDLADIGTKQDPLTKLPVATNEQVATSPEYAGLRQNEAADRAKAHTDAVYKQQVAQAVQAGLVDGKAPSLSQIQELGLSPADVNTMLAANNKGGQFNAAITANLEQQKVAATAGVNQSEIGLRNAEADLAKKRASALEGGGPLKKGGLTPDGRQVFYNGKGQQVVYNSDGEAEAYSGKVMSGGKTGEKTLPPLIDAGLPDASGKSPGALEGLDRGVQETIKKLANYEIPLPSGFALKSDYWQNILGRVSAYDPTFDASQYPTKLALRRGFTSGAESKNITGLNTAVGHINSLKKVVDELNNSDWQSKNVVENLLAKHLPVTKGLVERQGTVTSASTKFNAVKGEMASIFKKSGATDQEIKSWGDTIQNPATATPTQWKAFIDGSLELMGSRFKSLANQYQQGMGRPKDFRFLSADSYNILKKLGANVDDLDPVSASGTNSQGATPAGDKRPPLSSFNK